MPNTPRQQSLGFLPLPRETPRRATAQRVNYNTIERREVVPTNPPTKREIQERTERQTAGAADTRDKDGDAQMLDVDNQSSSEEELTETPSRRRALPSLVTIRREKVTRQKKSRKPREEST